MRSAGSPDVLEYRRSLAVQRVAEGCSTEEAADFLGIDPSSVRRWLAAYRRYGGDGLTAQPVPGRLPKLTTTQEKIVLRWLSDPPTEYGFTTDLWSAPRLVQLIEQEFDAHFHPNYLSTWLRQRGYTPQKPRRVPREQDDEAIAQWLAEDWRRIKQKARRRGACLLLRDESGLLMAPLLRRSWAPRGHPSESKYKAGRREKVSGRGGVVAAAVAGPPAPGLPDADQRLLQQRGGGRVPRLRCARVARSGDRYLGWREHAQGRPDPGVGGGVPGALGHRALARACAGVDAGGVPVAVAEVRTAGQFRTAGCPPLERGDGP